MSLAFFDYRHSSDALAEIYETICDSVLVFSAADSDLSISATMNLAICFPLHLAAYHSVYCLREWIFPGQLEHIGDS